MEEKIEKVHSYLEFLKNLGIKLLEDQANLDISASDTEDAIKNNFQAIKKIVLEELDNREKVLLDVVREFYVSESTSIENRARDASKNVEILEDLVDLQDQHEKFNKTFDRYIDAVRNDCLNLSIQKSTRITAQFDGKDKLITNCKHLGRISTGAPLKIIKILSQPGAILIKWDTIEKNLDVDEYCLQKMKLKSTSFTKKQKFEDCYVGPDTEFLDKKVIPNEHYAYRVCLRYENEVKWSEWSLPKLATTTLRPLCWKNNSNFKFSHENLVAESLAEKPVTLYSTNFKLCTGYYIEIMFLKCDDKRSNVFIGLSATEKYLENILDLPKALIFEADGHIYSDGHKKTTKLPPINQGRKVVFICEKFEDNKARIHIDNHNMRVTYDWVLENPEIHVCASFNSPNWKIAIN